MQPITPDWVQAGELGFAFVVVILCTALVVYVLKTSAARESKLLDALMKFESQFDGITGILGQMKDEFANRLQNIEQKLNIQPPRKKK